jgi:predicted regulator of Ras-like GTPase activity (Roadblock/LC7/MglB family)
MSLLSFFSKPNPTLLRLPSGSLTVDRSGAVVTRTLPSSFPAELVQEVAATVLNMFESAAAAHLPLSEVTVNYTSLKITARELRGGAMIFLSPRLPDSMLNKH